MAAAFDLQRLQVTGAPAVVWHILNREIRLMAFKKKN
jgi:hypothetical protein